MKLLKDRIVKEGRVIGNTILKVDSFLNHQMDIILFNEIGKEFKERFKDEKIDRILTIESSGIGIACIAAQYFNVPVVFAKKAVSSNLDPNTYKTSIFSFTKNKTYQVYVSQNYIKQGENVLIIDDFLANGQAALGLTHIVKQAGAKTAGVGIVIEKEFQNGRKKLQEEGIRIESLAIIESMEDGKIVFK